MGASSHRPGCWCRPSPAATARRTSCSRARCSQQGALARIVGTGVPDSGEDLVQAVFAGRLGAIRVLDRRPVRFFCACSRDRAGASLAILGGADLSAMILDDGKAEVICNFCRARYDFDDKDLERIRRQVTGAAGPLS